MSYVAFRLVLTDLPRLVSVGDGVESLLGFTQQDFLTAKVQLRGLVHPGDAELAAELFSPDSRKKSGAVRFRLRHADGKIRCIRGEFTKERREDGTVMIALNLADARIVTEPSDDGLVRSFKSLIEHNTDYIYIKNRNHVILAASRALPSLIESGSGSADLLGTTDYDNHPEETADIYYALEEKAFAEGRRANLIHQVPLRDGTRRWIDNRKYPINGPGGEFIGIFGVAPDITEYIEAQNRLLASEETLREAQEIAGLGNYELDLLARVWKTSAELDSILGIGADYHRGVEGWLSLVHPEDRKGLAARLESFIQGSGGSFDTEYRINRHSDGTVRWVHTRGRLEFDGEGRPLSLHGTIQDITERKKVDAALRESEESLRDAQAIAGLGSYVLDIQKKHWLVSPELAELLGIGEDYERKFEGIWPLIHPDDRPPMAARFQAYFKGERTEFDSEYRILRRTDGAVRWVHTRGRLELDEQGNPQFLRGTVQDITERKEAETALRENEEVLREAQRMAGLGIHIQDLSTGIWSASDILREILGVGPHEDLSSEKWRALVHPEDRDIVDACFTEEALQKGQQFDVEHRIIRPSDGAVRWIHGRGRVELDKTGNPAKLRGIVQDITRSKEADAELRENKELLQLFIEHAPVALAMVDLEMRYIAVSQRWTEMHGLAGRELVGHSHYETLPNVPDAWKNEHRRALAGETVQAGEGTLRRSDGSLRWVRRELRPWFTGDGKIGGIILFSEDITERKLAEIGVRESKDLLQLFIGHVPVALAMFDREMRYLAVSQRWAEDHSIDKTEILGRSHYEVNPHVPERWRETHRRGLAGETQRVEEDSYLRPDGTEQWIRWQIIPWHAGDGSVGGIVMFYEDITERRKAETALRESQELLRLFIDRAPAALAMFDREMRYLAVSRRWLEDYGLVETETLGRPHYEVIPDVPERWKEAHRRGLAGETLKADEDRFDRADGTVQWIRWEIVPWRTGEGSVGGIVLFAEDITKQKETEERLRLAGMVFTGAREGITITDPQGTILDVNDAFTRITGYTREEVLGRNPRILKSGLQSTEFYEEMWHALLHDDHWSGEIWNRSKSGDIFPEALEINAIRDANGKTAHYVAMFSDISEIKEHELQLEHIAHFDALTGLPNRALFADRLRQAMAQAHRSKRALAVAHFDLDGFKGINDRYSHSVGDGLLTAMAFRMKRALREGDTLARLGGDEFAAVMLELDNEDAVRPALERLLEAASEEAQIGEATLRVSASAGVTFYPQAEDVDADVLLRQAGQAMYQAKLAGGNRYHEFDPGQDLIARSRHENLEHIRQALEARQFVLHYQPQVNLRTGKAISVEALVRWQHPDRGLLPPGMFLPVIEDHPLSIELGKWVIDTALQQVEEWQEAGLELAMSVNVSAFELQQPDFADRLKAHLAAHPGVAPANLVLEVVETSALEDVMQTSHVLTACRELGVSIALDDFGIGYSSLTYLRRLPANILKIDQSFVRDMLEEPENLTILEGVIGLASAFRRQVIAEGVETAEHGLMLLQMGCEIAQGYGIARPMPAGELVEWLKSWSPDPRWADVPPVHASNRPVLYACVEHRAWLSAFEACLQGKRTSPPSLDANQCRVGAWLHAEKQAARGTLASIQAIETMHSELHNLAAEIFASQAEGPNSEGLARLQQLHYLHEKCLSRLRSFTRAGSGRKRSRVAGPARSKRN
ncbi:MAG: PAS domain S-box protein [Terracidiphilus sp.]